MLLLCMLQDNADGYTRSQFTQLCSRQDHGGPGLHAAAGHAGHGQVQHHRAGRQGTGGCKRQRPADVLHQQVHLLSAYWRLVTLAEYYSKLSPSIQMQMPCTQQQTHQSLCSGLLPFSHVSCLGSASEYDSFCTAGPSAQRG